MITISYFWFGVWILCALWIGAVAGIVAISIVRNSDS